MKWTWRADKNEKNKKKHKVSFETAQLVFDDPLAASRTDPHPDGDRWQTVGVVGPVTLFVIHTYPDGEHEAGQMISARKATAHERKAYEEGDF